MKQLDLGDVEYIAHALAKKILQFDEPIPAFNTRYPDKLESCLETPFNEFQGLDPYPTLVDKAAIQFYLMIKNHPFQNGNKRLAVTTLLVFLYMNGRWIDVDPYELYEFAKFVAMSKPKEMDDIVQKITTFISDNLTTPRLS